MKEVILKNAAECKLCHDVIESTHVHDYKHCKCGEIMVDGGKDYLRRGWKNSENFIERSEVEYHALDKWLSRRILAYLTATTDWKKAIPEMIRGALAYEAVFHMRKALDKIPEVYTLPYEVREKIEKAIQMEFIGENRRARKPNKRRTTGCAIVAQKFSLILVQSAGTDLKITSRRTTP